MSTTKATLAPMMEFEFAFQWMQEQVRRTSVEHGFGAIDINTLQVPTKLALIMTEVSEALEAHRSGDDGHVGEELADIVIRTMDLAESQGIHLAEEITRKAIKNQSRERMHGGKRY